MRPNLEVASVSPGQVRVSAAGSLAELTGAWGEGPRRQDCEAQRGAVVWYTAPSGSAPSGSPSEGPQEPRRLLIPQHLRPHGAPRPDHVGTAFPQHRGRHSSFSPLFFYVACRAETVLPDQHRPVLNPPSNARSLPRWSAALGSFRQGPGCAGGFPGGLSSPLWVDSCLVFGNSYFTSSMYVYVSET